MIIMHTTCHRQFGGLEKRIYNESCKMAERGHKIVIAAPDKTPLLIKSEDRGFRCIPTEFTVKSSIKDYFVLKRLYQKLKIDVLNTHGNSDSKIALLAASNINLMLNYKHDIKFKLTTYKKFYKNKNKQIIPCTILSRHISADVKPSWYNKFLYNRLCDYVFTTADYTTKKLISALEINPDRIFTIPSGVTPLNNGATVDRESAISTLSSELITLGKGINVNTNSRFIGFVGRVSEDKGVKDIIEAFLLLADWAVKEPSSEARSVMLDGQTLRYHLVIVGDGEADFISKIEDMINKSAYKDNIHVIGFRESTYSYYRAFDCSLLASHEVEGISQSLLEAMYARCPVAGSKIGGTCDIIRDGQTGFLFSPKEVKEIATAILQILSDNSFTAKLVEQAFNMVKDNYTIDSMVNKILSVYAERVDQNRQYI